MSPRMLLLLALPLWSTAHAQVVLRELGDFELKLATTPTRNMAHGLIQPARTGSFHGGLDLTHASGWYLGQWAPSIGLSDGISLEVDSYLGYSSSPGNALGYEIGAIRYAHPYQPASDRQEVYAGMKLYGSRFGAAMSQSRSRTDNTLLIDFGQRSPLNLGVTLKYARHRLNTPVSLSDGRRIRSYNDWSLNLSHPWHGMHLDLSYSSSDLSNRGCYKAYSGQKSHCKDFLMLKMEHPLY